ncbi:SMI1/KNR4 family protein [Flavobacterium selenitireducens]|uniref:SMI1/KNR4 family protein n=1 Tax=Flavobacterium selenitireducens TaxID=2722704 RepID=UPI00168B9BC7|nr:SMI1/KNR4 family protein [Flavobacterium selenitireducens]MBD3583355.1 SMI1/KNR4 family protein [Flavobacterium selenitireducens]
MTTNSRVSPQIFKTKEGFCLVFPDRLVFSKNEDGKISAEDKKDYTGCALFVFAILSLFFAKAAFGNFIDGHYFAGSMWLLGALFTTFCLYNSWNSRDADVLKRQDIVSMKLTRHSSVYKNSYLDIEYRRYRKKQDMRVELRGSLKHGDAEARHAIRILTLEGILVQDGVAVSGIPYENLKIEHQSKLAVFYDAHPPTFDWSELPEIQEVEKELDLVFPKSYFEYLAIAGGANRMRYQDIEFFGLSKLESRNKELRKKIKALDADFYEQTPLVTFAFRNGRYLYFRLDAGFDPKVYEILADKSAADAPGLDEPIVIAASFSELIGKAVDSQV